MLSNKNIYHHKKAKHPHPDNELFDRGRNVLSHCHLKILESVLPGGKVIGNEYVALNPRRADSTLGSFKFSLTTGRWADFAAGSDAKGGDIISLHKYITNGKSYKDSLIALLQMIGA